jgi:DNA repair protein RadC
MPRPRKKLQAQCPAPTFTPAAHHHEAHVTTVQTIFVILREEADASSRTGVAHRAYYHANGAPLQSLHIAGETEFEARARVLQIYPNASIEIDAKKSCCASCAAGGPCQSGACGARENPIFTEASGMAGEPLLAVYEGENPVVGGCGACSSENLTETVYPSALRFERLNRTQSGFRFDAIKEIALPQELQGLYSAGGACQGASCLPWIRVEKDPQRFRAALQAARKIGPIKRPADFCKLMMRHLASQEQETFIVMLLDVHLNVLGIGDISRGARDRVLTPIPDILRLPVVDGATAFIVAHNHPSGKTTPSKADKEVTKAIKEGADAIQLLFLDHIIVGGDSHYSFNSHGLI